MKLDVSKPLDQDRIYRENEETLKKIKAGHFNKQEEEFNVYDVKRRVSMLVQASIDEIHTKTH